MLLEYCLVPVMQRMEEQYDGAIFVHDHARPHVARSVKRWLFEHDIDVEDWPAFPPDLNPIKQVWKRLKELLQKHHPYIAEMKGGPDAVRAKLVEVLRTASDVEPCGT